MKVLNLSFFVAKTKKTLYNKFNIKKMDINMEFGIDVKGVIIRDDVDIIYDNCARELPRLIEVGASCFNHYCVGYDVTRSSMSYTMSTGV